MTKEHDISLEFLLTKSLDVSPDCLCIANGKIIIYCNDNFADIYGITKEEVIGKDSYALLRKAWHEKKGVNIETDDIDSWLTDLESSHVKGTLNQFETDLRDGRWFKMTRVTLECGYIVVMGADITELKNTQKALEESNKQLTEANRQIEQLANTDQLTGLNNRRAFEAIAEIEISRAKRYNQPLSLVLIDIDFFKKVNDTYGHEAGDELLKQFANCCSEMIRESDALCRIGGEEFVILLPMTNRIDAKELADRIRLRIASQSFYLESLNRGISITVSAGTSQLQDADLTTNEPLSRSDSALYQAKRNGRNQVCDDSELRQKS